jgi:hypothetical protein
MIDMIERAYERQVTDDLTGENIPPCKHCHHPGLSHDDEFGDCKHLGVTDTGHDVCECPGYEEGE